MPRPLLRTPQKSQNSNILSTTNNQTQQNQQLNKMQIDRVLRKKRSKEYINAIKSLDAGGHVHNQNKVNDIINIIGEDNENKIHKLREFSGDNIDIEDPWYTGRFEYVYSLIYEGCLGLFNYILKLGDAYEV